MLSNITYKASLNRNGYRSKDGLRHVVITVYCPLTKERVTVNTHVRVREADFSYGMVQPSEPNHDLFNRKISRAIRRLMEYEDEMAAAGTNPTPRKIKEAYKTNVSKSATLREFVDSVIMTDSKRSESTRSGYHNLCKAVDEFRHNTRLDEVDHDFVERFRSSMMNKGLGENTAIGRLKLLRCVFNEAIKRGVVTDDPFKFITIGNMKPKEVYLTMAEIGRIERVKLSRKDDKVRDLFLLACYSGLRWSDLHTLEEAEIKGGIMRKRMYKTKKYVTVPLKTLFWGKGLDIINKYPNIRILSKCVSCNSTFNKKIKEIAHKAGVKRDVSAHWGRKSCSTNLSLMGMPIQNITSILGQSRTRTTETHYTFDKDLAAEKMSKKLFKTKAAHQDGDKDL